jgi:exodeoxyribonuclease VII small subunit
MNKKNQEVNFEKNLARIDAIVKELEKGTLPLQETLKLFEEASTLIKEVQQELTDAEKRIKAVITVSE